MDVVLEVILEVVLLDLVLKVVLLDLVMEVILDLVLEEVIMFGRGRGRIRWFKKVLVVILWYLSNIELQMDRIGRDHVLEGRDQDRKLRNNLLYTAMGGLGGV